MILPVLQYPDPRLQRLSERVEEVTTDLRALVDDMVETMYERDGVGLAAPQIGKSIRLVVIDTSGPEARNKLMILINPELTLSGPEIDSEEGCLSVADLRSTISRSALVHLKATDLEGNLVELDLDARDEESSLLAICLQHECDHLDGKLFVDRMGRLKKMLYDNKIAKKRR